MNAGETETYIKYDRNQQKGGIVNWDNLEMFPRQDSYTYGHMKETVPEQMRTLK
jgi:hypothetical protein